MLKVAHHLVLRNNGGHSPDVCTNPSIVTFLLLSEKYNDLLDWSVDNVKDFWENIWRFCEVRASKGYDEVCKTNTMSLPRVWLGKTPSTLSQLVKFQKL